MTVSPATMCRAHNGDAVIAHDHSMWKAHSLPIRI